MCVCVCVCARARERVDVNELLLYSITGQRRPIKNYYKNSVHHDYSYTVCCRVSSS
jgi:hypothetical protein